MTLLSWQMKNQKSKIIKEFASYFDQELQTTLPIAVLPDGSLVYKDFLVKQLDNKYWGVYNITSKDLINEYFLKSCALMAAKEYFHRHYEKYQNVKMLDNKYASVSTDALVFKNNISLVVDDDKYQVMLTRLEESKALSQYYHQMIFRLFRQSFI
jgi:hypothetical protein